MADLGIHTTLCPTFAISSSVTAETFGKLNSACQSEFTKDLTNYFNPVPNDLSHMMTPSSSTVDFLVEVIEDPKQRSPEGLLARSEEVEKQASKDGYESSGAFAVLDDRSTKDDTVLIYYNNPEYDEVKDESTWELVHWRVRFTEACTVTETLDYVEYVVIDPCLIQAREEFTGDDGVFQVEKAMREAS